MVDLGFKEKVEQSLEKNTIDRLINTEHQTDMDFIVSLFEMPSEYVTDTLKTKAETEQSLYEEYIASNESNTEAGEDIETDTTLLEKAVSEPVVSAEEIRPELVEYIKTELMEQMQTKKNSVIDEFINGRAVSQEEFYKLQLLSCFPLFGIPIYFFFLVVLSVNKRSKYTVSIQNYAKAQLRTFWIYLIAHGSVLFVAAASMTSLINIIQRGLAA